MMIRSRFSMWWLAPLALLLLPELAAAADPSFKLDTILPSALADKPFL